MLLGIARFHTVVDENAVRIRELGKVQERLSLRKQNLEQKSADLRRRLHSAERSLVERYRLPKRAPSPQAVVAQDHLVHLALGQKTVLCVGGRSGNIPNYRDVMERVDGRFAHHDGGLEDNALELDASPAAADLVICQAGCISHNAYSRVQDFGERTGKQCV